MLMFDKMKQALLVEARSSRMGMTDDVAHNCVLAIAMALREVTKEMVEAGDLAKDACIDSDYDSDADGNRHDYTTINSDLPAIVFRAMIDAVVADEPLDNVSEAK